MSNKNELNIKIIQEGEVKVLDFNFEQLKIALEKKAEFYSSLVYTEEQITNARDDRSALNKFKTAIDDKRKDVKKELLIPYVSFEKKIEEIKAIIDKPINVIDAQIKEFEAKVKKEREENVLGYYDEIFKENFVRKILPFEKIFDTKWINASTSKKTIKEDLSNIYNDYLNNLKIIKDLNSKNELILIKKLNDTRSLSEALKLDSELKESEQKLNELNIINTQKSTSVTEEPKLEQSKTEVKLEQPTEEIKEPIYELILNMKLTRNQSIILKEFLDSNKIKYEKIN